MGTDKKMTVGVRILIGLDQAIAWREGKEIGARVTHVAEQNLPEQRLRETAGGLHEATVDGVCGTD
jgi:hypothetical protein